MEGYMILKTIVTVVILAFCVGQGAFAQDSGSEGSSTFPSPARPENIDEWKTHMGVLAGYSGAEGDFDSTLGYGVDWGIQPYIPFAVGAELASTTSAGNLTRTTLLGRGTYNFGGTIPLINRSYIGAMLGPVWDSQSRNDGLRFGIAPVIGFDMPLWKEITTNAVTLGLNARYLMVNESAPDTFALNGAMKYWF
jgi:hypothetical protein